MPIHARIERAGGATHVKLVPSIVQIAGVPSLPCHRMSDLPSPLTSLLPLICQLGPGLKGPTAPTNGVGAVHQPDRGRAVAALPQDVGPAVAVEVAGALDLPARSWIERARRATDTAFMPSISQIAAVPSLPCHRMSDLPSPSKSPLALICQFGPGLNGPAAPTDRAFVPSISQIAAAPPLSCHRMSDLPSPLKSPLALICQLGPGLNEPTAPTNVALVPSISQIAGVPSLPCQRMSDLLSPLKSPLALTCQLGPGLNGPAAPTKGIGAVHQPYRGRAAAALP